MTDNGAAARLEDTGSEDEEGSTAGGFTGGILGLTAGLSALAAILLVLVVVLGVRQYNNWHHKDDPARRFHSYNGRLMADNSSLSTFNSLSSKFATPMREPAPADDTLDVVDTISTNSSVATVS